MLFGVLSGCAADDEPRETGATGPTSTQSAPSVTTETARGARRRHGLFPGPSQARPARVTGVSDGDTLSLSGLGKVRLIGVDTPEVFGEVECYGRRASAFTKRVLRPGRQVSYRLGVEERDRYGRALAYVWLADGRLFNGLLVLRGYAQPLTIPPNDDLASRFVRAARRARRRNLGLWGRPGCADRRKRHPRRRGASGGSDRDCSDFTTQAQAQRYFDARGGSPANDVDRLDGADHDGRVCESLP